MLLPFQVGSKFRTSHVETERRLRSFYLRRFSFLLYSFLRNEFASALAGYCTQAYHARSVFRHTVRTGKIKLVEARPILRMRAPKRPKMPYASFAESLRAARRDIPRLRHAFI
jgi:hypothetical protein